MTSAISARPVRRPVEAPGSQSRRRAFGRCPTTPTRAAAVEVLLELAPDRDRPACASSSCPADRRCRGGLRAPGRRRLQPARERGALDARSRHGPACAAMCGKRGRARSPRAVDEPDLLDAVALGAESSRATGAAGTGCSRTRRPQAAGADHDHQPLALQRGERHRVAVQVRAGAAAPAAGACGSISVAVVAAALRADHVVGEVRRDHRRAQTSSISSILKRPAAVRARAACAGSAQVGARSCECTRRARSGSGPAACCEPGLDMNWNQTYRTDDQRRQARTTGRRSRSALATPAAGCGQSRRRPSAGGAGGVLQHRHRQQRQAGFARERAEVEILPDRPDARARSRTTVPAAGRCGRAAATVPAGVARGDARRARPASRGDPAALHEHRAAVVAAAAASARRSPGGRPSGGCQVDRVRRGPAAAADGRAAVQRRRRCAASRAALPRPPGGSLARCVDRARCSAVFCAARSSCQTAQARASAPAATQAPRS